MFGSRFASASQRKILLYWHGVANHFLTWLTNILNDINLTDMETCYKAVRADILKQTPLYSNRFGIEPELTTKLAQWNIRLYEVPISYHGRTVAEGKKIGWKDAVSAIWTLLKYRFIDDRFTTHDGYYVLQSMRRARGLNRWILEQFRQFIGQRVLEAGCGHRQLHRAAARSRAAGLRRQRSALRRDGELAPRSPRERAHAGAGSVRHRRSTQTSRPSGSTPSSA